MGDESYPNNAEIVWDNVRSHEDHELIRKLTLVNPRRTRKQRRAFKVLATLANRRGLLVPVKEEVRDSDPSENLHPEEQTE